MAETKGHCKHGEFELTEGCPQCMAEAMAERKAATLKNDPPRHIVQVRYGAEATEGRPYSYYSEEALQVGDLVEVPAKNGLIKARVITIGITEAEIASFKDFMRTIPAGSVIKDLVAAPVLDRMVNLCDTCLNQPEYPVCSPRDAEFGDGVGKDNVIKCENYKEEEAVPAAETAVALRPGEDIEAHGYFGEALELLEYAEARVIATAEDAESATNDLAIISKLRKVMDDKRKGYLAPLKEKTDAIRATYDYLLLPILQADRITREKMTSFKLEEERKAREAEELNRQAIELARKQAALHNGEFTVDITPVVVSTAPKLTRTELGTSSLVANWKYRVIDLAKIPREYMVPDDAMLKSIAKQHHDQKPVPGIEFYNEPYTAVRK